VKKDVLDYEASKKLSWPFYTPTKEYADFTSLDRLPKVKLKSDYKFSSDDNSGIITFKVSNPSESIAFFLFFDVLDPSTMKPILPVYWNDNYVSLLPGEERTFTATYRKSDYKGGTPLIETQGWNVDRFSPSIPATKIQSN
jgi:exo-1,4-beta-D-glucosaminidase